MEIVLQIFVDMITLGAFAISLIELVKSDEEHTRVIFVLGIAYTTALIQLAVPVIEAKRECTQKGGDCQKIIFITQ